jgi:aspartyl-tRNA(Asn)/glutamyl-tRNA(Gln) amidotransferase subunit A
MEPWQLGLTAAADLIRAGALAPSELAASLLARIEAFDTELLAWVTVDAEGAMARARAVELRLARRDPVGSLAGVPIGIKDVIDVAGLLTTASSAVRAGSMATEDAACIGGLRAADATILGKLHTAEFACADPPPTRNPWNHAHTPGGSSSGSGVAVAAGMVPAALGTQTGGSTLRPAVYNGVVGLKPSYGMISNRGVIPVSWSFDHVGVIARSVSDAAAVLGALAGHDPMDPASSPMASDFSIPAAGLDRPPTIGVIRSVFLERCEPGVATHTLDVVKRLEAEGASVREVELAPSFERIAATVPPIFRGEMYAYHREEYERLKHLYRPMNAAALEEGSRVLAADYVAAARERPAVVADLEALLAGVDILLTPGTPAPAPRDTSSTGDASFQTPWSYAGLPAIALPSGIDPYQGLPLGIQLIGHRWGEAPLLQAAAWCEQVLAFDAHPSCWPGFERTQTTAR